MEWRQGRKEWIGRSWGKEALVVEGGKYGKMETSGGKFKVVSNSVASGGHVNRLWCLVCGGG